MKPERRFITELTPLLLADCSLGKAQTIVAKDQSHVIGKIRCDGRKVVSDRNVANNLTSATSCLLTVPPLPMALIPHRTMESLMVSMAFLWSSLPYHKQWKITTSDFLILLSHPLDPRFARTFLLVYSPPSSRSFLIILYLVSDSSCSLHVFLPISLPYLLPHTPYLFILLLSRR